MINNEKKPIDYYYRNLGGLITDNVKRPMSQREFWCHFREAYTSHEKVYDIMTTQYMEEYLKFVYSKRALYNTMVAKEKMMLAELCEHKKEIIMYRGSSKEVPLGSSFTLDEERAIWFATRFGIDKPTLTTVRINPNYIDSIWNDRDETEIFMLPTMVKLFANSIVDKPINNVDK